MGEIVRYRPDPDHPPELTPEQRLRLETMREEEINLTEIPDQSGRAGWHPDWYPDGGAAMRRAALRDGLLVLEPEVVEFFKASGEAPAEKMQTVPREYIEAHRKTA